MKLLVTGAWADAKTYMNELKARGHHVLFLQQERDEIPCDPKDIEGVICNGLFLYHDIREFTSLRYIQLTSAGFDRVPLDYIKEKQIEIRNARGVYSIPMAEHAISGVLELYRKAYVYHTYQKNHIWKKERDLLEINGKTVLIIGCGSVGSECAKRFKAFNADVYGIDPFITKSDCFDRIAGTDMLDTMLPEADILVLTVPLTDQTEKLIGLSQLHLMKNTAVLVNISRGKVVDQKALENALINHEIYGAVIDVFEEEPLPGDSKLWGIESVILTPHISFIGDGMNKRLDECILSNIDMI